jgi:hypothetical protein
VTVVGPTKITCAFDLTAVPPGARDVVDTNPGGQSAALTNGFTVTGQPVPTPGDIDGDVDLDDYLGFAECLFGPGVTPNPAPPPTPQECLTAFDFDFDDDADLPDFAAFQGADSP